MTPDEITLMELDQEIKSAQATLVLSEALEKLQHNPDFQTLIVKGYLTNEAVRLVHLLADPNMQTPESQATIMRDINAIGSLSEYFRVIAITGKNAAVNLRTAEETRNEILSEE